MYSIRKRKDKVFDGVTEADLKESGVIVENPFIGSIPSKEEVLAELENLLMSM